MKRKKAIGIAVAAVVAVLAIALVWVRSRTPHVHEYTKWAYDDAQHWKVCEVDGAESEHEDHAFDEDNDYICECGAQHIHTYEWRHDSEYHWKECPDGYKTRKKRHVFNDDGVCECGEKTVMTSVHGTLMMYNNGTLVEDYDGVTFTLTEADSGDVLDYHPKLESNGAYSFKAPRDEKYILTISKDEYVSDSIAFDGTKGSLRNAELVYIAYVPTPGMENWGLIDYSQLGKNIVRLDNDMQFLFTKKTYNKVALSVVLQSDWDSAEKDGRQGVIFRFKNGDDYVGVAPVQALKDSCIRGDDEQYSTWGWDPEIGKPLTHADGGDGKWLVDFEKRPDLKEKLAAGKLKLTVLRDGSVLYVFLDDEFVGFEKFDDKYKNMECEAGFYYYDFKGSTIRNWNVELIENTSALEKKIPIGSLDAAIKIKEKGTDKIQQLADGEKVTIEKVGGGLISGEFTVTNGKIKLPSLLAGKYRFTYGDTTYYALIKIEANTEYTADVVLQDRRFDLLMGWDWDIHDFSHVYDDEPTIGVDGGQLNVISLDSYQDVAASLWLKKDNSLSDQKVQGIAIKFSNGEYMFTRCQLYEGDYKLQWVKEIWDLPIVKPDWQDYQSPLTDEQMKAFEGEEGLKLTLIRTGNLLAICINDQIVSGATLVLDDEYASMDAQIGFFAWDGCDEATWRFDIEPDISAYAKYLKYIPTHGMENWGEIDFSRIDDNIIGLDNDMQFIFSRDTFKKVAFSVTLQKDWYSGGKVGRQGVIFRFKDGKNYAGVAPIQALGDKYLRSDDEPYDTWGWNDKTIGPPLTLAEGWGGEWLVNFDDRPDLRAKLNAGELTLTVLRDGNVFYAFANGEYIGFKKYADKYADMECEVGFYYYDFAGSTKRDWHIELIEDTSALEAKVPRGSLNAAVKLKDKNTGEIKALADGQKVTIERIGGGLTSGDFAVTNGRIALSDLLAGTYRVTYGADYYAQVKIGAGSKVTSDIILQYKRFDMLMGWGEDDHDFSHVNDENPTIGNDSGTLNVITRDKYTDVAASLWIKRTPRAFWSSLQTATICLSAA